MFQRNQHIATQKWNSPLADHSFLGQIVLHLSYQTN